MLRPRALLHQITSVIIAAALLLAVPGCAGDAQVSGSPVLAVVKPASAGTSPAPQMQEKGRLDQWVPLPMVVSADLVDENARYWLMLEMDERPLEVIAREKKIPVPIPKPRLVIEKSTFSLTYYSGNAVLKVFPLAIGKYTFEGPKFQDGDARTPEGDYYICRKLTKEHLTNPLMGTRWMQVSYPNVQDAEIGLNMGIISKSEIAAIKAANKEKVMPPQTTALGGGIGIHGGYFDSLGKSTKTWTGGCIGMRNADIEEIFRHTPLGTPITIKP